MAIDAMINALNEKQKEAVTAPLANALILAGAGSGKTRVLVNRIAWLIYVHHLEPSSILAVTFTNKAAKEMRERLQSILSMPTYAMWVGTFHGLCHRMLRTHYKEAQLPEAFQILDAEDQARLIKRIIVDLQLDLERWPVKQAQAYINGNKDEGLRPQHINPQNYGPSKTLLSIYQAYENACAKSGLIDFAEIMIRAHELLRDNEALLHAYQKQFKAILVDEFQDTNTIQYAWLKLLAGSDAVVMAVGDDDQSIYGWRGAKVENIHKFLEDYHQVQVIRLEQNYRSTKTILSAANALIEHNSTRMGKNLWSTGQHGEKIHVYRALNELEEARFVTHRIRMALNEGQVRASEIAVLYRSNAQSRVMEEALLREGIAYRIHGGLRFFERAEVKDAIAYLRLVLHPEDDTAFERIVNFPTRGIGEKSLDELRLLAKNQDCSLWQAISLLTEDSSENKRGFQALVKFRALIEQIKAAMQGLDLENQVKIMIQESGLYAHYAKIKGEKSESKLENLNELAHAAAQFRYDQNTESTVPSLSNFLAHAALESGELQAEDYDDYVHLMTLHSAKGLEFPYVFLVGIEEGIFPSRLSLDDPKRLEEERRLCYVGMTRAMQWLCISYAEMRRQHGRQEYHKPSRFLRELPKDLLEEVRLQTKKTPIFSNHIKEAVAEDLGLRLGQVVSHKSFGSGIIIAVEGEGAHTRIQVQFESVGSKWLVLAYANLQVG